MYLHMQQNLSKVPSRLPSVTQLEAREIHLSSDQSPEPTLCHFRTRDHAQTDFFRTTGEDGMDISLQFTKNSILKVLHYLTSS